MKRKLLLLSLFLLIPRLCFALLDADTIFEWRSTATADTLNGGGFNSTNATPGTDRSTTDGAYKDHNDLVIGAVNTTVTSATHPFTSDDNGNIIHITAGTNFTTGWYEVVSVVDIGGIATLDRACGTALATGGTYYLGGALNVKAAGTALEDDFFEEISGANSADGITVYFYNNNSTSTVTFTFGEAANISGTGGTSAPIKIIGYKTTRGDNPTGTSRPTIAVGGNTWTFGNSFDLYNLIVTGTGSPMISVASNSKYINCKLINSSTTADRGAISLINNDNLLFNCEAISYRGRAVAMSNDGNIISCYLHDSDMGIRNNAGVSDVSLILGNLIESNVTYAIYLSAAATATTQISGNTLYGSEQKTGTGISITTGTTDIRIINNIIYGFVTGVSHADTQTVGYDDYNDYFNNTNDVSAAGQWQKGSNDQAVNPTFTTVAQVTGTTATYTGTTLTDNAANFTNVVDNQDFILIISGTGLTTANYQYLITSHTQTTVITSSDAGESSASDWVYQVTTGRNFAIGTNLKALGFPGAFQAGLTTGYMDIGAVQRQEAGGGTTSYGFAN